MYIKCMANLKEYFFLVKSHARAHARVYIIYIK